MVQTELEQEFEAFLNWLTKNIILKANPHKYYLFISTNEERHKNVRGIEINNSKCKKLLGIKIAS